MNELDVLLTNLDNWGTGLDRANLRNFNQNLVKQVSLEELKTKKLYNAVGYLTQNKAKLEKIFGSQIESQEEELRTIENERNTNANILHYKNDTLTEVNNRLKIQLF